MVQRLRAVFVVVFMCVSVWHVAGCQSPDRTAALLSSLQEGKARGHLVVTTGGSLSVGQQIEFFIGARDTALAFDGDVDFTEAESVEP